MQDTQDGDDFEPIEMDKLSPRQREACARMGWPGLMPVQARSIPPQLAGRDMMVQSRTGSGKTGGFLLPLIDELDAEVNQCQTLILAPTRELAQQVAREAERLFAGSGLRIVPVYGGVGYGPQLDGLRQGAHVVVGTPGRILDHLMRGTLSLRALRVIVFDEADRLLSMGFYPDMRKIKSHLTGKRRGAMFSATFPTSVQRLAREFLNEPTFLGMNQGNAGFHEISHVIYELDALDKDRALIRIIELENPSAALIFCNTKMRVNYVATVLKRFGYDADQLTSDLPQRMRDKVLADFGAGKLSFLVATDVAARGIDIEALPAVFQYELPEDLETFVHRAGRTARAGASGIAFALSSQMERRMVTRISAHYKLEFEKRAAPTDEQVERIVAERTVALLEGHLRELDDEQRAALAELKDFARELSADDHGLGLVAMILDDAYQLHFHGQAGDTALHAGHSAADEVLEVAEAIDFVRMREMLDRRFKERDRLQIERMKRLRPLARELADNDDEIVLIAMRLKTFYIQEVEHAKSPAPRKKAAAQAGTDAADRPPRKRPREGGGRDGGRGGGGRRR